MTPIKLGHKYECCPPCNPCGGLTESSNVAFPSTYLETKKPLDLPKSGIISLRFERTNVSHNDKSGRSCVNIDFLQIVDVKEDAKAKKLLSTEQELDRLRDEVVEKDEKLEESGDDKETYVEED